MYLSRQKSKSFFSSLGICVFIVLLAFTVRAQSPKIVLPVGPSEDISFMTLSPDEALLFVADRNNVFIYEVKTQRLLTMLDVSSTACIAVSPDNESFAICSYNGVDVYSATNFMPLYHFSGLGAEPKSCAYSPDNKMLAIAGLTNKIVILEAASGREIRKLEDDYYLEVPGFSSDSKYLRGKTNNHRNVVWEINSGTRVFDKDHHNYYKALDSLKVQNITLEGDSTLSYVVTKAGLRLIYNLWENRSRLSANRKLIETISVYDITAGAPKMEGKIARPGRYNVLKTWDVATGKLTASLVLQQENMASFVSLSNGKIIFASGRDLKLYDPRTKKSSAIFRNELDILKSATYTPAKNLIVAETQNGSLKIWNSYSGQLIESFKGFNETVNFSSDSLATKLIFNERFKKTLIIASLKGDHKITRYEYKVPNNEDITATAITGDGQAVAFGTRGGNIRVLNDKMQEIFSIKREVDCCIIYSMRFSKDGRYLFASHDQWSVYDLKEKREIPKDSLPSYAHLFPKDVHSAFAYNNNTSVQIEMKGQRLDSLRLYSFKNGGYLILLKNGYYLSTQDAARKLSYGQGRKLIAFEQLDIKYNRPDKVLEALMSVMKEPDTALINSYKKAYEKRIRKLGLDTASFEVGYNVPEADFKNRDAIPAESRQPKLALRIAGADAKTTLARFNIWINETPLFGINGFDLRKRSINTLDTTIIVTLSDGENTIETSLTNINETESYRIPLTVNYIPKKPAVKKLYFIGIGINNFSDKRYNLNWSVKDIRDLSKKFKSIYGVNCVIDTLFDRRVTARAVTSLKARLKGVNINDRVIIAYSGHGLLSKDFDYFLSTYDVNFSKPESGGLPYLALENLLDSIPSRNKLMLIDACHSGELDKEELVSLAKAMPEIKSNNVNPGGKGIERIPESNHTLGLKNSFELMQSLFVNITRSTGATIISAAGGMQFALEKNNLRNGVFSYSLLEYLKTHPHARVSELRAYVNKRVSVLTAGMQTPTTRSETSAYDWYVW